jgi:methionine sulfoxide reductase heme-binding subunit
VVLVHLTSSPVAWYAARAGGVVAYLLLTAVVLLGLQMSSRRRIQLWPRIALEDVHRFAAFAAGSFVVIHIVAIAIDSYLPFSLTSIIVPFIAHYRAAWVGIGIVAAELMLAVAIANRLRGRVLSYATWRKTHYATFAVWTGATIHGIGSGTDRSSVWLVALEVVSAGAVAGMTAWRVFQPRIRARRDIGLVPGAAGALAAGLILALTLGPFKSHTKPWNAANFSDALTGSISRRAAATRGIVSLAGSGRGDQNVLVRADLLLAPARLLDTSFQMEYLPSGDVCRGHVTQITPDGLGFDATCSLTNGDTRSVHASWLNSPGVDISGGTLESSSA